MFYQSIQGGDENNNTLAFFVNAITHAGKQMENNRLAIAGEKNTDFVFPQDARFKYLQLPYFEKYVVVLGRM